MHPINKRLASFGLALSITLALGCAGNHDTQLREHDDIKKTDQRIDQDLASHVLSRQEQMPAPMPPSEHKEVSTTGSDHSAADEVVHNQTAQNIQARLAQVAPAKSKDRARQNQQPQVLYSSPAPTANGLIGSGARNSAPLGGFTDQEQDAAGENYASVENNNTKLTAQEPVSTFSIDVDTGAYANVRRFINSNALPPSDAVRVEEMINYFNYDYATPRSSNVPFSVSTELATTPWNADTQLLQVGLKGYEISADDRPAANLVFLLDVSGSMNNANKLPLLKKSFRLLTKQLTSQDRISIVVYAGASGVVLEPTPGDEHREIMKALGKLRAGGSTNGAAGINLAYQLARDAFIDDGINRIILATDGDFNVGTTNFESLVELAEHQRQSGISLTTLGFGTGNYNDHLMEQLADAGNGNYAYIDTLQEARKVLVKEVTSTLVTIAKDVKVQIEFNPNVVSEYRLIGYENRILNEEDFVNDKIDAGEIGAGHTVTALYEIKLAQGVNNANYSKRGVLKQSDLNSELGFLKLRYKQPKGTRSTEMSFAITKPSSWSMDRASDNLRFAAAVAGFAQLLKQSEYVNGYTFAQSAQLAQSAVGKDKFKYRSEFVDLIAATEHIAESHFSSNQVVHID